MTHEELAALMSEPPGGTQHGRKRGADGGWVDLEEDLASAYAEHLTVEPAPAAYHRPQKPADTRAHGTRSAYTNDLCRCDLCRAANAAYFRSRRRPGGA